MGKITDKKKIDTAEEFQPTQAQTDAIDHYGSDLLISAGAGSGKTATLTDRIVNRISKGADISRMLVVTYTNDAANELKARITKKLSKKLASDPKNPHLCSQIVKIASANISTIHSFCLKVLRPRFDKLGLDSNFRIGEETELGMLKLDAINEIIDEFYEADTIDPDFLLVSDCYSSFTDDETLGDSLLQLYAKLSSCAEGLKILLQPMDYKEEFLETQYGLVLVNHLRRIVEHYIPIIEPLYKEIFADDNNYKYQDAYLEFHDILLRLQNALKCPKYDVIKGILESYEKKSCNKGKKNADYTVDVELVKDVRSELSEVLQNDLLATYFYSTNDTIKSTYPQNRKICDAVYKILDAFDKRYKEKKKKHGLCDFNDLERYTLQLFYNEDGTVSDIAESVKAEFDELYIDEYQDVNSIQDKIFQAISNNNRFMVGDIKQSIYRFRAAEPELFSSYRDSFMPYDKSMLSNPVGKTIFMSENFRCDPTIIDFANHVSDHMFTATHGFSYVPNDRLQNEKKPKGVFTPLNDELCLIDKSLVDKEKAFLDPEAEFVAREIKSLIGSKLPNGTIIEPKHIAILLRKRKGVIDKYIEALTYYGIKHEYEQEVAFFEKPHILLFLCILNAIDNPSKDIYFAGALRSGIFGFSLDQLVNIKHSSPEEYNLYSAFENYVGDPDLRNDIDALLKNLDTYRRETRSLAAHDAISYVINKTAFLSSCDAEARQDIIKLYCIARDYEGSSFKGLYSFLRYVDDVASKKGLGETVSNDPQNSVKIITMHKSKGLEYEICFLCDTNREFSDKSYTAPILYSKKLGICGYVSRQGGIIKYDNLIRKCVALSIKDTELEEHLRLIYVAMTRARTKLYITATLDKIDKTIAKKTGIGALNDEHKIYSASCQADIFLDACAKPLSFLDVRKIDPSEFYKKDDEEEKEEEEKAKKHKVENSYDANLVEELSDMLSKRFDFKYQYDYLQKIPSKLSVSTLYPGILDSNENEEYEFNYSIDSIPKFASKEPVAIKGSDRGTATHVFMQFCDFKNLKENGVEVELNRLIENGFISPALKDLIEIDHLEMFRGSQMIEEFISAGDSIIREFRFNIMIPASQLSTDPAIASEKVLVQGVTDCIYEDKMGNLILVDYKTDKYDPEKGSPASFLECLRERHRTQLTQYRDACNMMFDKKIHKVLVYSVPLADTVEID